MKLIRQLPEYSMSVIDQAVMYGYDWYFSIFSSNSADIEIHPCGGIEVWHALTRSESHVQKSRYYKKNPFGLTNLERMRQMFTRNQSAKWMQVILDEFLDLLLELPAHFENENDIILILAIQPVRYFPE